MTDEQPTALRLADLLDGASNGPLDFKHKAAAELRRLHAVNKQLLEALQKIEGFTMSQFNSVGDLAACCQETACAAIQAAKRKI